MISLAMTRRSGAVALMCVLLATAQSRADSYPSNTVRILVPTATGTPPDIISRIVAAEVAEAENWRVIVQNRPGALQTLAGAEVLKQPADGLAIYAMSIPVSSAPALMPNIPFRPEIDFVPVIKISSSYNVLVVNPSVPAKSVADLIALLKERPDGLNFSSAGFGTPSHLIGEMFKVQENVRATHVPYQQMPQAIGDLLSGTNQYMFVTTLPVVDLVSKGPRGVRQAWRGSGRRDRGRVRQPARRAGRVLEQNRQGIRDHTSTVNAACDFRVTLLGTGVPTPRPDRFGPSTLIEAGNQKLLIDAGRGATIRLYEIGVPIGRIDALFLTHFHSDHTIGIPDLWLTGWLQSHFGTRSSPFCVIGPSGTQTLMSHLEKAYADDIRIRMEDERLPADGVTVAATEFEGDGLVYENNGVKVVAFEVDHGDVIKPAYGYRIEYGGRAVVMSGDTRRNSNVLRYGTGADLLIHEVAIVRPELASERYIRRIMAHHTTAYEAGQIFDQAKPRLAAFTHLVFLASESVPPATLSDLVAEARRSYSGPLIVGEDLMSFEIGDAVVVRKSSDRVAIKA